MRTVDIVVGNWSKIFNHYSLPPITGKRHFKGECPVCKSKGDFRIDDKNGAGTWICKCGSGDGWGLLKATQGKDFQTLAKEIDELLGNTYQPNTGQVKQTSSVEALRTKVLNKFNRLRNITNTPGMDYLKSRGIEVSEIENVRFCETENTKEGSFSAIYSLATDSKGNPCYLHRTLLDGSKKADVKTNKKMNSLQEDSYLEYAQSVAIRLTPVSSTLGIAEGIETALSCHQIYKCKTWATLNAAIMKKFVAPKGVKHLMIFADTDDNLTGHAAAYECGRKNLLSGNDVERVSIRWPTKGDFNDVLNNGCEVHEWKGFDKTKLGGSK